MSIRDPWRSGPIGQFQKLLIDNSIIRRFNPGSSSPHVVVSLGKTLMLCQRCVDMRECVHLYM